MNPQSYYLGHAYNPERHKPADGEQDCDVTFIGSGFPRRRRFFEAVDWSGIDLHVFGHWKGLRQSPLLPYLTPCIVDNEQTVAIYQRTRIGLQLHRADKWYRCRQALTDPAESLGPRSFELAGCGTFQISDWRPELTEIFGDTVPVFKTPEEMERLIRYYLAHESERGELAAAQHEAVREHTFENRIKQALELIAA
jgi:spore maturation protein CgeB